MRLGLPYSISRLSAARHGENPLTAMLGAFQQAAAAGQGGACVEAALEVAKDHPRDEIDALTPHSPLEPC
jgi:hypothetical protein